VRLLLPHASKTVFVGERQMESLDQEVELKAATPVQFLSVLPIQGG